MATSYQYRLFDTEFGPVGFRELVRLVREESQGADDLVKADWETDWHPAAEVVGLFHMAGRADVLAAWEAEQQQAVNSAEAADSDLDESFVATGAGGGSNRGGDDPAWQRRLEAVQAEQQLIAEERERELQEEFDEAHTSEEIRDTILEAEAEFNRREASRRPGIGQRLRGALAAMFSLHGLFRWGMVATAANFVALGILAWSETEAQRFPKRGEEIASQRIFPLVGKCSSGEYLFLLVDAVAVAALGGYGAARGLESLTDD